MVKINLYTTQNCPKCKVLKKLLDEHQNAYDIQIIELNPQDQNDTDVQLLIEKGFTDLPIMLVDDTFLDFKSAVDFIKNQNSNKELTVRKLDTPEAKLVEIKLRQNLGYCPCSLVKTEDTKCICKDFREQTEPGKCNCGLFEKF